MASVVETEKLLTIAIPTYNRAPFLKESLTRIISQVRGHEHEVEILVSNNCSSDSTEEIVLSFASSYPVIRYNKNQSNLGMDGNFVYCFEHARAKYVWILGDDDYLEEGALEKILDILRVGDYGLVHLKVFTAGDNYEVIQNKSGFMSEISYWITFISANIVRTKYVRQIDFSRYMDTYFTLIPVYLTAVVNEACNVMVRFKTMNGGQDIQRNGGYNIFQVFVTNYLNILKEFRTTFGRKWYECEKYKLCREFLWGWMVKLLATPNHGLRFKTDRWPCITFSKYWYEPYFYVMLIMLWNRKWQIVRQLKKEE